MGTVWWSWNTVVTCVAVSARAFCRYGPGEGRYSMIKEACGRLSPMCPPFADILRDCCIPSPALRPSSSSLLPRLQAIVPPGDGAFASPTPFSAPLPPLASGAAGVSISYWDILTAVDDTVELIGDVFGAPAVSEPSIFDVLSSTIDVADRAGLLRASTTALPAPPSVSFISP